MLGQVGLLRGLADRDILIAAGDGQHRAARARQLRKYRGPVSQRRGGGPRAAGGRQGGRADSPVRVGASAPPGESGASGGGAFRRTERRGPVAAGRKKVRCPGRAAERQSSPNPKGAKRRAGSAAGRNRSRLPAAAGAARRGPARRPRQHDDWAGLGGRGAKWWRRGPAGWGGVGSQLEPKEPRAAMGETQRERTAPRAAPKFSCKDPKVYLRMKFG